MNLSDVRRAACSLAFWEFPLTPRPSSDADAVRAALDALTAKGLSVRSDRGADGIRRRAGGHSLVSLAAMRASIVEEVGEVLEVGDAVIIRHRGPSKTSQGRGSHDPAEAPVGFSASVELWVVPAAFDGGDAWVDMADCQGNLHEGQRASLLRTLDELVGRIDGEGHRLAPVRVVVSEAVVEAGGVSPFPDDPAGTRAQEVALVRAARRALDNALQGAACAVQGPRLEFELRFDDAALPTVMNAVVGRGGMVMSRVGVEGRHTMQVFAGPGFLDDMRAVFDGISRSPDDGISAIRFMGWVHPF